MARLIVLWSLVPIALSPGCHDSGPEPAPEVPHLTLADAPACAPDDDPFDLGRLEDEVRFLAHDGLLGRSPGTGGDALARAFIEERFRCLGLAPVTADGSYQQPFVNDDGIPTANVVASIPGAHPARAQEVIVVGAHHDGLGVRRGQVMNGANDNASGVVAMLAMARALRKREIEPARTIVFVAFGSEEAELEGSNHFVANRAELSHLGEVAYLINLDMLGTYEQNGFVDAFGSFSGTPARAALDRLLDPGPPLEIRLGRAADQGSSDFEAFCEAAVPYFYFETFDTECWHQACDDAERIDYANLIELTRLALGVTADLADDPGTLATERGASGCPRR